MKIILFMICSLFSFQVAMAQETPLNDVTQESTSLIQKAEKERIKAEQKIVKQQEKDAKAREKAQKKAEKAKSKAEKEVEKQQKAIAKKAKAENGVAKIKSKIAKQEKKSKANVDTFNKLKLKGKLSEKDEIKWNKKMLDDQSKNLDLKSDLDKAESKLRKL